MLGGWDPAIRDLCFGSVGHGGHGFFQARGATSTIQTAWRRLSGTSWKLSCEQWEGPTNIGGLVYNIKAAKPPSACWMLI